LLCFVLFLFSFVNKGKKGEKKKTRQTLDINEQKIIIRTKTTKCMKLKNFYIQLSIPAKDLSFCLLSEGNFEWEIWQSNGTWYVSNHGISDIPTREIAPKCQFGPSMFAHWLTFWAFWLA